METAPESLLDLTGFEEEFEKQFMLEIPETTTTRLIEAELPKQFSPKRLTRAFEILKHYGLEDGIHHLKEADPEIAQQFENLLGREQLK